MGVLSELFASHQALSLWLFHSLVLAFLFSVSHGHHFPFFSFFPLTTTLREFSQTSLRPGEAEDQISAAPENW